MKEEFLAVYQAAVSKAKPKLERLALEIYEHPEVGMQEFFAAKVQTEYLKDQGFNVTEKFGGVETAFAARAGSGKPVVAIFSEYDALPEVGHACGHHLIALSALTAFTGLAAVLEKFNIPGTALLVGSPAEEALGGKVDIANSGALNEMDYALITHPYYVTNTDPGNLAVSRFEVEFHGRAAHASVSPEKGLNALDAVNLLFAGISCWRQQLPQSARVHGIITHGGDLPNIIPDYTKSFFYLRSPDNTMQHEVETRFNNIVEGAALMTGCEFKIIPFGNNYAANKPSPSIENAARKSLEESGFKLSPIKQLISTDFANMTLLVPATNLMFSVIEGDREVALHSIDFRELAALPYAYDATFRAGQAVADTALKILTDPELRRQAEAEFK